MHSFPLKTSSIPHRLLLNVHTQSLAACSPPSILLLAAISCPHILWPPTLTTGWQQVTLLVLCSSRSLESTTQLLSVLCFWPTLHLPILPLPASGCWALSQRPISITSECHSGLNVQLGPALLFQKELHKSIWKIRLLVPRGHTKPYLLFPSIYGHLRIRSDFRSTY